MPATKVFDSMPKGLEKWAIFSHDIREKVIKQGIPASLLVEVSFPLILIGRICLFTFSRNFARRNRSCIEALNRIVARKKSQII